jgi:hypothetical protein
MCHSFGQCLSEKGLEGYSNLEQRSRDSGGKRGKISPRCDIFLITTPAGIDFEACYEAKEHVTIDNIAINIIDLENLIKAKKASRRRDLADVEELT